jgi:hypothetical protein
VRARGGGVYLFPSAGVLRASTMGARTVRVNPPRTGPHPATYRCKRTNAYAGPFLYRDVCHPMVFPGLDTRCSLCGAQGF